MASVTASEPLHLNRNPATMTPPPATTDDGLETIPTISPPPPPPTLSTSLSSITHTQSSTDEPRLRGRPLPPATVNCPLLPPALSSDFPSSSLLAPPGAPSSSTLGVGEDKTDALPSKSPGNPVTSSCSLLEGLPLPPDGGYAWVVCAGSFLCMVILDGMLFSFGVFFLDLLDEFGETKGRTSWVGSTLMGTHLIMGPLTAILVNIWDCRRVALLGSVLATIAFASSTMSPNLHVLILLYGFLGGVGMSMVYIPAILVVGFYFEKKRALANGIANSGSGLGTFIYAPLSRFLLDEFTWRGGLLILSGLVLNCAVCAALFRPLGPTSAGSSAGSGWKIEEESLDTEESVTASGSGSGSGSASTTRKQAMPEAVSVVRAAACATAAQATATARAQSVARQRLVRTKSHGDLPLGVVLTGSPLPVKRAMPNHIVFVSSYSLKGPEKAAEQLAERHLHLKKYYVSANILNKPLARKDAFYSGSMARMEQYTDPQAPFSLSMLRLPAPRDDDDESGSQTVDRQSISELIHNMLGLTLMRSPTFLMCVMCGVLWTTHSSVLSILPDYAVLKGIPRGKASLLVSTIGITNIVGRLAAGYITDCPRVHPVWVNTGALLIGSATTFAIPFTSTYGVIAFEAAVFGLCMGAWTSLRPILLVEMLGLDRLTNAFGLMAMFQGIAFVIGGPITGTLFDYTNSYLVPFVVASCAFLISGLVSMLMLRVARCEARHSSDDDDDFDPYIT